MTDPGYFGRRRLPGRDRAYCQDHQDGAGPRRPHPQPLSPARRCSVRAIPEIARPVRACLLFLLVHDALVCGSAARSRYLVHGDGTWQRTVDPAPQSARRRP